MGNDGPPSSLGMSTVPTTKDNFVDGAAPTARPTRRWSFRTMSESSDSQSLDDVNVKESRHSGRFGLIGGLPSWEQPNMVQSQSRTILSSSFSERTASMGQGHHSTSSAGESVSNALDHSSTSSLHWNDLELHVETDKEQVSSALLSHSQTEPFKFSTPPIDGQSSTRVNETNVDTVSSMRSTTLDSVRDHDLTQRRARRKDGILPPMPTAKTAFRRPPRPAPLDSSMNTSLNSSLKLCDVFDAGNKSEDLTDEEALRSAQEEEIMILALERSKHDVGSVGTLDHSYHETANSSHMSTYHISAGSNVSCDDMGTREEELIRLAIRNSMLDTAPIVRATSVVEVPSTVQQHCSYSYSYSARVDTVSRRRDRSRPPQTDDELMQLAMEQSLQLESLQPCLASRDCQARSMGYSDSRVSSGAEQTLRYHYRQPAQQYCSSASPSPSMAELEVILRNEQEALEYALERSIREL